MTVRSSDETNRGRRGPFGLAFLAACVLAGVLVGLAGSRWLLEGDTPATPEGDRVASGQASGDDPRVNDTTGSPSHASNPVGPGSTSESVTTSPVATTSPPASTSDSEAWEGGVTARRNSYHDGIMRVAPAVVSLYAEGGSAASNQGSGVIIDKAGIVLTNLHLLEDHTEISVVLEDGREFPAARVGDDPETDLAVLSIAAEDLPSVPLTEGYPLRVGDIVLAIGNPFGVGQTVTQGIVSATQRRVAGASAFQDLLQIDAPINPGNSGGALITPDGELVGITSAVLRGDSGAEGIGYAIPATLLRQVVPQIIDNGSVQRGWLGVGIDDISLFPALQALGVEGVLVSSVLENSPASLAGLKQRDIVLRIGEQVVHDVNELMLTVSALPPGATVKVTVLRGVASVHQSPARQLEEIDLKARLGSRPNN